MKITLEFDAERIARSFLKALPKASPEEIVQLLKLPQFQSKLAEDMLSLFETTNEAEPSLIPEAYTDFFAPATATQQ